jgi:hypothetical protein
MLRPQSASVDSAQIIGAGSFAGVFSDFFRSGQIGEEIGVDNQPIGAAKVCAKTDLPWPAESWYVPDDET